MIRVALCQIHSHGTPEENMRKMVAMTERAVAEGGKVDIVVFPEYAYSSPQTLNEAQEQGACPDLFTNAMCALARRLRVNLIPGSFLTPAPSGKHYNTALFINRQGEMIGRYHKIHLMAALGANEAQKLEYGTEPCVFETEFGRAGLLVCYDLRFPELARGYVQAGAEILFVPSMFPVGNPLPPRSDHWDQLVEATALLNLTYTVAVNQFGRVGGAIPFGRSRVVDPWGTVIAQCSHREDDIAYAAIDLEFQEQIRRSVATWENRRPEVYTLQ